MRFDSVKKEHVIQAASIFEEKGAPEGFGDSMYYQVIINGKPYPPKPIMAYANQLAEGVAPVNDFGGGKDEPSFKAYDRLGFEIVEKNMGDNKIEKYLEEFALIADDWFDQEAWFQPRFDFYKSFFTEKNIENADWNTFQELGNQIHSFQSMAIARSNALGNMNMPIEDYRRVFKYIMSEEDPINVTINNLYKRYNGTHVLPYFSDSSISELIGYAFPEKYIFYNRRDLAALSILGINLPTKRAEKFGDQFLRYNEALKPVRDAYPSIVGLRTNTTLNLEIDQFFSWLYMTKKDVGPILELLEQYKVLIREKGLEDEKYKWEFIREYKGKPDLEKDISIEIRSIRFPNLIYHLSAATLRGMADEQPEGLKEIFRGLRDEDFSVNERVRNFLKATKKIYKKTSGKNSAKQDERSFSVYMTLFDPQQYTFYKDSYYQFYCNYLGVKPSRTAKKYSHYLDLVHELAENFLSKEEELNHLVQSELGDLVDEDPNLLLLAQDVLYQTARANEETNYWIFQGNPDVFDFKTALEKEVLKDWSVTAHKDKIKTGDKVILWIAGSKSGCYALAEVTSDPQVPFKSETDSLWKEADKSELKAGIKITHNLVKSPVLKERLDSDPSFKQFRGGNQGTNFKSTKEEYDTILSLSSMSGGKQYWLYAPGRSAEYWEEVYEKGLMGLGWKELGNLKQYNSREEIWTALANIYGGDGSKKNDVSANDDFLNKMKVGDIVFVKKGRSLLLGYGEVTSDYFFEESRHEFNSWRKVHWLKKGKWSTGDYNLVLKTLTDITGGGEKFGYDHFYEFLFALMGEGNTNPKIHHSLNTILYGPPGTGKTYLSVKRAAEIVSGKQIEDYDEARTIFQEHLNGQIEMITFHQNYSYEDFIQGLRPDVEDSGGLSFERRDGIFKRMADRAKKNLEEARNPSKQKRDFYQVFDEFIEPLNQAEIEEIEVPMARLSYFITGITAKSIEFRKASGGTGHTLSINTLEKMYAAEDTLGIQGLNTYYKPLLNLLLEKGRIKGASAPVPLKNYVLIIDEINRANISRVFGELITLIEPDKRYGAENELPAKLPSGEEFWVPKNLYLLGTMNTADKSIALLDIALRRRFKFEPMYPNYDVPGLKDREVLEDINKRIIKEKGHDFQIGHSYFMKDDLETRMNDKVIPLLLEYFMNDVDTVKDILKQAGINFQEGWPLKIEVE